MLNNQHGFKAVIKKFLVNYKVPNYSDTVKRTMEKFKLLGYNMGLKIHFLDAHMGYFLKNLRAMSEE